MSNQIMPKSFWCPTCKVFPDEIAEHYHSIREYRRWDGIDTYELFDSDGWEIEEVTCYLCGSNLEVRGEEMDAEATPPVELPIPEPD